MLDRTLQLAVIDDDPEDVRLLRRSLGKIPGLRFTLNEFSDGDVCPEQWEYQDVDILFVDYLLGDRTGLQILERIRGLGDPRPVIILTGQKDERTAAALLESGADEYIAKLDATPEVLEGCIRRALSRIEQHETCEVSRGPSMPTPYSSPFAVQQSRTTSDAGGG